MYSMVRIHENESEFPLSLSFYYNQLAIVCVCTISFMESKTLLAPEVQLSFHVQKNPRKKCQKSHDL